MANITTIEPIRYAQDVLKTDKSGLLVLTVPLDATALTQIDGLSVAGEEPSATSRKLLLKWNETWKKWNGSAFVDVSTQSLTVESVLEEGNIASELNALTMAQLSPMAGQSIYVAIALYAADPYGLMPTAGFSFSGKSDGVLVDKTVKREIDLSTGDGPVEITDVEVETEALSGGTVTVTAQVDGGEWIEPDSLIGNTGSSLNIKALLHSPNVGESVAAIKSVTVKYKTGNMDLATGVASVISKTYDFSQVDGTPLDMGQAHLMVKRLDIPDTEIKAYLSLRQTPVKVKKEILGSGDGLQHIYDIANKTGLATHTVKVYFDQEEQTIDKYALSGVTGQITCTAPEGVAVWIEYEYGWEAENFVQIVHDRAYPDVDNPYMVNDQFNYVAGDGDPAGSIASVRLDLIQQAGTVSGEVVGNGMGRAYLYWLKHNPVAETLAIYADGVALDSSKWLYDPITSMITIDAPSGTAITASYDWIGRQPRLNSAACVWNLKGV